MNFTETNLIWLAQNSGSIIFLLIFAYFALFKTGLSLKIKSKIGFLLLAFSFVYVGFRATGLDYKSYKVIFEEHVKGFFESSYNVEPGYVFINYTAKYFGFDYVFFVISLYFFCFILLWAALKKDPLVKNHILSFLFLFIMLFYFAAIDVLRGFFVSVLFYYGFLLRYNKSLGWIGFSAFSMIFHYSSLISSLFYVFSYIRFPRVSFFLILFVSLLSGLLFKFIFFDWFFQQDLIDSNYLFEKLLGYIDRHGFGLSHDFVGLSHLLSYSTVTYSLPFFLFSYSLITIKRLRLVFYNFEIRYSLILEKLYVFATMVFVFFMAMGAGVLAVRLYLLFSIPMAIAIYFSMKIYASKLEVYSVYLILFIFIVIQMFYSTQLYLPSSKFYPGF